MHRNRAVFASVVLILAVFAAGLADARRRVLRERQMARTFTAASSHSATYAGAIRTTFPLSFAAWIKVAAYPGSLQVIMSEGSSSSVNPLVQLRITSAGKIEAAIRDDALATHTATSAGSAPTGQWVHVAGVWSSANAGAVYLNGSDKAVSSGTLATITLDRFGVGVMNRATPAFYFDGDIGEPAVWGAALSDSEVAQLAAGAVPDTVQATALRSNGGWWRLMGMTGTAERDRSNNERNLTVSGATRSASHPSVGTYPAKLLVCDGNSLTAGSQSTTGYDYPCQLQTLVGTEYEVVSFGVSSQTTADMIADAAGQVDPLYSSSNAGNWCVMWEGTNDIFFDASSATAYANIVDYCEDRRAAGYKVAVGTIMPRGNWPGASTIPGDAAAKEAEFEVRRAAVNADIRANWSSFADAIVDIAADDRFDDYNDTTYFAADKVHLNDTGYGVVAALVQSALEADPTDGRLGFVPMIARMSRGR